MLRGMELGVLGEAVTDVVHAAHVYHAVTFLRELSVLLPEMLQGERAMLDIKPGYAFLHKDSGMSLPQGLRREAPVVVDVTVSGCTARSGGGLGRAGGREGA